MHTNFPEYWVPCGYSVYFLLIIFLLNNYLFVEKYFVI